MGFVYKFVVAIFSAILLGSMSLQNEKTEFIYLNNPETLKTTGILHQKKYSQNTNVRYFFHFKNGTKSTQKFYIKSNFVIKDLKYSYNIHRRPEFAGAKSTLDFMKSEYKNDTVNLSIDLKPNETISGMMDGKIIKDDNILFQFGNEKNNIRAVDYYQTKYQHNVNLDLKQNSSTKYRLGENIPDTVKGQYGSSINIVVNPKETGILKMSFSPRGGAGLLVFSNRGKIFITKLMPAFKKYDAFMISVEKGKKETFTFIPCGGLNYPINLDFSLQQYELNPDIA